MPGDARLYADLIALHLSESGLPLPDAADLVGKRLGGATPMIRWSCGGRHASRWPRAGSPRPAPISAGSWRTDRTARPTANSATTAGLFEAYTWALLGLCWLREDEPERAFDWLRRAEAADRSNPEIRVKRAFAEGVVRARATSTGREGGAIQSSA